MPDPADYGDHDAWMEACVPTMMDEGKPQDQAVAACGQMWRDRDKAAPTPIDRAWSILTVKSIDNERREIEGVASTPSVDRAGDIVEPMGAQFSLPMPLLWQHDQESPVGHVVSAKATKSGITIKAKFAKIEEPGLLKDVVDKAWQAVKAGLVRGLSIGFKPNEWSFLEDQSGGIRFMAWNWYELSLVTIPAQQDAKISVVKSLDQPLLAASGRKGAEVGNRPGATGKTSVSLKLEERAMKTIDEQVSALEAKRAANAARMKTIMDAATEEGRSTDDAEGEEFDGLRAENDKLDGDLNRFKSLQKANVAKAAPVSQVKTVDEGAAARAGGHVRISSPKLEPGIRFARVVKCLGLAQGNRGEAARIAEERYYDDPGIQNVLKVAARGGEVSSMVTKAAVEAASTTNPNWAGWLVGDETSVFADFAEWLRPMTIVGKFGNNGIPSLRRVPFRVALLSQTSAGSGYWVGEGKAKPLTRFSGARTTLEPLKVANIAVVTEELLRDSSPSADMVVRDELGAAITERIDIDFTLIAKTAVVGVSPASITNGVAAIPSSGNDEAGVRADVLALMSAFAAADNPPTTGVWVMASTTALALQLMVNPLGQPSFPSITMMGGTFFGLPVIVSEHIEVSGSPTARIVILMNAGDIYLGDEGGITIDMSREATLQMDDAPTQTSSALGSPQTPVATTGVSLWQTNSVGFRAERTINWSKRRATAVQVLSGVAWGT